VFTDALEAQGTFEQVTAIQVGLKASSSLTRLTDHVEGHC
jgi:hypothetical protein